jgi:hypothetical protein
MAKDTTSGSGVLDDILSSTKCDHMQITSETEDLMMHEDSPLNDEPEPSMPRAKQGEKRRRVAMLLPISRQEMSVNPN